MCDTSVYPANLKSNGTYFNSKPCLMATHEKKILVVLACGEFLQFFLKTRNLRKLIIRAKICHVRVHKIMMSTWKGVMGEGLKFVACFRILLFLNIRCIVHFGERWGDRKILVIFRGRHKLYEPWRFISLMYLCYND